MKKNNFTMGLDVPGSLSFSAFMVFLCGAAIPYKIYFVGQISLAEFLLPLVALFLVGSSSVRAMFRMRVFKVFLWLSVCMLLGFVISDIVRSTAMDLYIRGWARVIVLIVDIVALAIIFSRHPKHIWWYVLGIGLGGIVYSAISGVPITHWKLVYGYQFALVVAVSAVYIKNKMLTLIFCALAVISLYMDSRSIAGFCFVAAIFVWARTGTNIDKIRNAKGFMRAFLVGILGVVLLLVLLDYTGSEYSDRREQSTRGRLAGLYVGLVAIIDSPFIGTGSWGADTGEYYDMVNERVRSEMSSRERYQQSLKDQYQGVSKDGSFMAHSQVIQSWMEGGILGALFFLYFGYRLIKAMMYVGLNRRYDNLSVSFMLLLTASMWHLLMSPFGGGHRLIIAVSVSIICMLELEQRVRKKNNNSEQVAANEDKNRRIISAKKDHMHKSIVSRKA